MQIDECELSGCRGRRAQAALVQRINQANGPLLT